MVEQSDIISVDGIAEKLVVISNNTYNESEHALVCPIISKDPQSVLSLYIELKRVHGYILCDNPRQLDLSSRGHHSIDRLPLSKLIIVLDMLQSALDYY